MPTVVDDPSGRIRTPVALVRIRPATTGYNSLMTTQTALVPTPLGASRAVGMANASNPIALIVPCHRVIRAGGAIGGYGFGPETKRWLLDHERSASGGSLTRFVASSA